MPKGKDKLKAKAKEKISSSTGKKSNLTGRKITMKLTLGTPKRAYVAGDKIVVGKDISEETAQGWLDTGAAELTSEAPGPSETK